MRGNRVVYHYAEPNEREHPAMDTDQRAQNDNHARGYVYSERGEETSTVRMVGLIEHEVHITEIEIIQTGAGKGNSISGTTNTS